MHSRHVQVARVLVCVFVVCLLARICRERGGDHTDADWLLVVPLADGSREMHRVAQLAHVEQRISRPRHNTAISQPFHVSRHSLLTSIRSPTCALADKHRSNAAVSAVF